MLEKLLSLAWHDVELLNIFIDRSDTEKCDTVRLDVEWGPWEPKPTEKRSRIEFTGCYRIEAAMNFGIIGLETFDDAWLEPDHPEIARIQALFQPTGNLFCMVFETNSTGSIIRIFATDVTMCALP